MVFFERKNFGLFKQRRLKRKKIKNERMEEIKDKVWEVRGGMVKVKYEEFKQTLSQLLLRRAREFAISKKSWRKKGKLYLSGQCTMEY